MFTLKYVPTGNVRVWKHTHQSGFTVPEVDSILLPYAKKTYNKYYKERYEELMEDKKKTIEFLIKQKIISLSMDEASLRSVLKLMEKQAKKEAKDYAFQKTQRECEQGMQGIEYKLNTVGSSRGDYPAD